MHKHNYLATKEHLARYLHLPHSQHSARISGIAGLTHGSPFHYITSFVIHPWNNPSKQFNVSAIIVPRVTCDLPTRSVRLDPVWTHQRGLQLADILFGNPSAIDVLLVFVEGRHRGLPRHLQQSLDGCSLAPPVSINRNRSSCPTTHIYCPATKILGGRRTST